MNRIIFILTITLVFTACTGRTGSDNGVTGNAEPSIQIDPGNIVTINFEVEGMTCTGCEGAVVRSLKSLEGVAEVEASHQTAKAVVKYDKTLVTEKKMEEAIFSSGYAVSGYSHKE